MTSKTRYTTRYRCGLEACRRRFRHNDKLKRSPKCPDCGDILKVRNIEMERRRELRKQDTCHCGAYPFPHRSGSLRACFNHPFKAAALSKEEQIEYEKVLNTARSG